MCLTALDQDAHVVDGRHRTTWAIRDLSDFGLCIDVQTEDHIHFWIFQHALLDHQFCTAFLSLGNTFFRRLEDELHRALQIFFHGTEDFRHPHQDGYMCIMAAGMHHAYFVAVILCLHFRCKREIHPFRNRQSVHVGTQRYHRTGLAALQQTYHAGMRYAGLHFQPKRTQMVGDDAGGPGLPVAQFGMCMKVPAPGDHLRLYLSYQAIRSGAQRILLRNGGRGGQCQQDTQACSHM